jgi:hypothetical protein
MTDPSLGNIKNLFSMLAEVLVADTVKGYGATGQDVVEHGPWGAITHDPWQNVPNMLDGIAPAIPPVAGPLAAALKFLISAPNPSKLLVDRAGKNTGRIYKSPITEVEGKALIDAEGPRSFAKNLDLLKDRFPRQNKLDMNKSRNIAQDLNRRTRQTIDPGESEDAFFMRRIYDNLKEQNPEFTDFSHDLGNDIGTLLYEAGQKNKQGARMLDAVEGFRKDPNHRQLAREIEKGFTGASKRAVKARQIKNIAKTKAQKRANQAHYQRETGVDLPGDRSSTEELLNSTLKNQD